MKVTIDEDARTLVVDQDGSSQELPLYSAEAFAILARQYQRVGWGMKQSYRFSWMGRPVIQLPDDMVRAQELITALRPDVLVETGVAHGGSLVFYASLFEAMGHGRVVGVDVEIRPHNRAAIEAHPLFHRIDLVEGDSVGSDTVNQVRALVGDAKTVLVMLDSNHTRAHVAAELEAYAPFVTLGSYLVVADGVMEDLGNVPRAGADWATNNPLPAVRAFLDANADFELAPPALPFDESLTDVDISYWPEGYLKRVR